MKSLLLRATALGSLGTAVVLLALWASAYFTSDAKSDVYEAAPLTPSTWEVAFGVMSLGLLFIVLTLVAALGLWVRRGRSRAATQ